eukprot:4976914-Alexandrium_andersonii.AAC.1
MRRHFPPQSTLAAADSSCRDLSSFGHCRASIEKESCWTRPQSEYPPDLLTNETCSWQAL